MNNAPEILHRRPYLEDESGREVKRAGPAHCQVVHGPMDGERSDVAPGKENRTDNIGIRAERQSHAVHGKDCPIVQRIEEVVAKLRKRLSFFPKIGRGRSSGNCQQLLRVGRRAPEGQEHRGEALPNAREDFGRGSLRAGCPA